MYSLLLPCCEVQPIGSGACPRWSVGEPSWKMPLVRGTGRIQASLSAPANLSEGRMNDSGSNTANTSTGSSKHYILCTLRRSWSTSPNWYYVLMSSAPRLKPRISQAGLQPWVPHFHAEPLREKHSVLLLDIKFPGLSATEHTSPCSLH